MDKKLKSVELFLALGLAATVNVAATQAAEINQETNHNNLHISNDLTTPSFIAEGGEDATMDHGQDHSTEETVEECPGGVNVNTGECLPTDEGGEGGEGGEG